MSFLGRGSLLAPIASGLSVFIASESPSMRLSLSVFAVLLALIPASGFAQSEVIESIGVVEPRGSLETGDLFGFGVGIYGDRLVLLARSDGVLLAGNNSISVYRRDGQGAFTLIQKIVPDDGTPNGTIGIRQKVVMTDELLLVPAVEYSWPNTQGAVLVYRWNGQTYDEVQILRSTTTTGFTAFGDDVALDRDHLFVTSPLDSEGGTNFGAVHRYTWSGSRFELDYKWVNRNPSQQGHGEAITLIGPGHIAVSAGTQSVSWYTDLGSNQWTLVDRVVSGGITTWGNRLASNGEYLFISWTRFSGAPSNTKGLIEVRKVTPNGLEFEGFLSASGATVGPSAGDAFSASMTVFGNRLFVGAPVALNLAGTIEEGRAFIFENQNGQWVETHTLVPDNPCCGFIEFGSSVAFDGSTLVFGAIRATTSQGIDAGAGYVFEFPFGESRCAPVVPNSLGERPSLGAYGSMYSGEETLSLRAGGLPGTGPALLLAASSPAAAFPIQLSQGELCLGTALTRLAQAPIDQGEVAFELDWSHPAVGANGWLQPGTTTYFQAWYRDANPGSTSNLTSLLAVTLE